MSEFEIDTQDDHITTMFKALKRIIKLLKEIRDNTGGT